MRMVGMGALILIAGLWPTATRADCPSYTFACPTGQPFNVGTCWSWGDWQCETCGSVLTIAMSRCSNNCGSQWASRADGCSIPVPGLKEIWNEVFHAACDLHDLCYASLGHTQADCDRWFDVNMIQICQFPGIGSAFGFAACIDSAQVIYQAVVVGGKSSFDNGQVWAKTNCGR